jgi:hypothetical protein
MNKETNPAGSIPTDRLKGKYYDFGFQYYVAGRCAVASLLQPVAGNLFHHAIEMLLKGALFGHVGKRKLRDMGHELESIWKAFKARYAAGPNLQHFDAVIAELNKFEEIRYPEKIVRGSVTVFGFGKPTIRALGGSVPAYNLSVGEIDSLVKAICEAANINAKAFTMRYEEPARTYLKHENRNQAH